MNYVIGDVHGCYDEMIRLLHKIEERDRNATIYFVGDFIDRGPKVWETLQWAMANITAEGKYRAVRGNHEDMVCEWFQTAKQWWAREQEPVLGLKYGLHKVLKKHNVFHQEYLKKLVEFIEDLPLYRTVEITTTDGKQMQNVIAHAYVPEPEYVASMSKEESKYICLWERRHMWGFHGAENQVLVHGHTPTISEEYMLRNPKERPGMIAQRSNCINVDSGCCFFYTVLGRYYPCMLSAICLETREEFYSDTVEERFEAYIKRTDASVLQVLSSEEGAKIYAEEYWAEINNRAH